MTSTDHKQPAIKKDDLLPWRRADSLTSCSLYWIPARIPKLPESQEEWLLQFFGRLSKHLQSAEELTAETFLQIRLLENPSPLRDRFYDTMLRNGPLMGLSRRPGSLPAVMPTRDDGKLFAENKKEYRPFDYIDDNCYWFTNKDDAEIRTLFMGYGGLSTLFLPKEPSSLPPRVDVKRILAGRNLRVPKFLREDPVLRHVLPGERLEDLLGMPPALRNHPSFQSLSSTFRVDSNAQMTALLGSFRQSSKEVFGAGMKRDAKFEGLLFIIPRLTSQDFFANKGDEIARWFSVFDTYVNESPTDEGIILASKVNRDPLIAALVADMRKEKLRYWEG